MALKNFYQKIKFWEHAFKNTAKKEENINKQHVLLYPQISGLSNTDSAILATSNLSVSAFDANICYLIQS